MNCFACLREIEAKVEDGEIVSTSDAAIFMSHGNYGSTVLDMEDATVEVLICDACLVSRRQHVRAHVKHQKYERTEANVTEIIPDTLPSNSRLTDVQRDA